MRKPTSKLRATSGRPVGYRRLVAAAASLSLALGLAAPALADDGTASSADAGAAIQTAAVPTPDVAAATTSVLAAAGMQPATATDAVANTASTTAIPGAVSPATVVSVPVAPASTPAPPPAPPVVPSATTTAPPPLPVPTPDPAPAATPSPATLTPTPTPAPAPVTAPTASPSVAAPTTTPTATPVARPQYQVANSPDTNSGPNTPRQTTSNPVQIPSSASGTSVLNLDWNDLVNCSSCNVTINVRILSPGDDGAVEQLNAVSSTSVSDVVDSVQQTLAQQLAAPTAALRQPVVVPPVVVPVVVSPVVAPPLPTGTVAPSDPPTVDAPPATTEAPAADTASTSASPAADATTSPPAAPRAAAADIGAVPVERMPRHVEGRAHQVFAPVESGGNHALIPPAVAQPRHVAPAMSPQPSVLHQVEAVAAPTDGGRRIPRRAPPPHRLPPADGPVIGSAAAGQGSDQPPSSPANLLALLVFLAPGFAQWLWARTGSRPRALRAGRPERPG